MVVEGHGRDGSHVEGGYGKMQAGMGIGSWEGSQREGVKNMERGGYGRRV